MGWFRSEVALSTVRYSTRVGLDWNGPGWFQCWRFRNRAFGGWFRSEVGLNTIRSSTRVGLDWTGPGRFQSGPIPTWAVDTIGEY